MMKMLVAGVSALAMMAAAGAYAQTATSTSASGASSNSGAASRAAANSGASTNQQNINFNSPGDVRSTSTNTNNTNARDAVSYSGGTTNWNNNSGDVTVRTTPTVYAPPVSGGNPCTLAVSGGVSVIGWGAAAGGTFVDQDCANRQKIAMVHNAGYAGVAKELMCNDRDTYYAFKTAGQACAFRQAFEPAGAVAAPVPVAPVAAPVMAPAPVVTKQEPLRRCRGANDQGPCYSG